MLAKDVMTANVISVSEDTPIHDVIALLLKYRISAVPVVDNAMRVTGIVSEGDLLRSEDTNHASAWRTRWLDVVFGNRPLTVKEAPGRTAGSVMTRTAITVDESTPLPTIAALLERHRIKRVPVLREDRLVGIVSRANLLHGLANTIIDHHEPGAAKDRQIRQDLMKILLDEHKLDTVLINVVVNDGHVRLWGTVESTEEALAAERAAKAMHGVKSVENNLSTGPMSGVPL